MKLIQFMVSLLLVSTAAWAQPARNPQAGASQAVSEQRRVELRETLKARRESQPAVTERTSPGVPPKRQLSAQERSDLRQQLRPEGRAGSSERP